MNGKNKKIIYVIVAIIILGFIGWHAFNRFKGEELEPAITPSGLVATSTTIDVSGVKIEGTGNAIVSIEKAPKLPQPVPNLAVSIVLDQNLPESVRAVLAANIKTITEKLKKDPNSYNDWMDLGMQWKIGGGYERTREYWEYAAKLSPTSATALINLGDLYAYYLKDNTLAENRLLAALKNAPAEVDVYFRLIDFYADIINDKSKAKAILQTGLQKFPNNPDLKKYEVQLSA